MRRSEEQVKALQEAQKNFFKQQMLENQRKSKQTN
jgi:hypothetical protein